MALLDFFKPKTPPSTAPVAPILPEQIYKEGVLKLQDALFVYLLRQNRRHGWIGLMFVFEKIEYFHVFTSAAAQAEGASQARRG